MRSSLMDKSISNFAIVLQTFLAFAGAYAGKGDENLSGTYLNDYLSYSFRAPPSLNGTRCYQDIEFAFKSAEKLNLWALKMMDSSAKLPSGILSGNLNQFGDFDECLSARSEYLNLEVKGKYCLANVDLKARFVEDANMRVIDDLIHSHRVLTNELTDQGHRIPKIETFVWGVCVPSSCTHKEIETILRYHLKGVSKDSPYSFEVNVGQELCYVEENKPFTTIQLIVIVHRLDFSGFFSLILSLTVLDAFVDLNKFKGKWKTTVDILNCFSLRKNWKSLMSTKVSEDDIECLHGGRFLNAVGLLLSHKQMAMLYTPTFNRAAMGESFSRAWTMLGRSAILYTDSFIMFSGVLASYSFVKSLDEKKTIDFKEKLLSRIVRFTPNLLGIILFCTYLMNDLNSGPQWGLVVTKYADLCKKNMWRNFLYIHNYFGFENMCLTHTHQLGIDMQLFVVSPIFIYTLWKSPKMGTLLLTVLSIASTWLRYEVTKQEELSTLIYYGISVDKLWKTANLSYILPTHRLTVYLMGIMLGYYLRRNGKKLSLNRFAASFGWILAVGAGLFAMFGPYEAAFKGYVYEPTISARFNAFAPILWVSFLTWSLIACINGYGGYFNSFLGWKYFRIFTKISYGIYLTQFPVFFYGIGTERTVQYFKGFRSLFDLPELCAIVIASILLTLMFDMPFQEIKKVLMKASKLENEKKEDGENSIQNFGDVQENSLNRKTRRKLQFHGT